MVTPRLGYTIVKIVLLTVYGRTKDVISLELLVDDVVIRTSRRNGEGKMNGNLFVQTCQLNRLRGDIEREHVMENVMVLPLWFRTGNLSTRSLQEGSRRKFRRDISRIFPHLLQGWWRNC